MDMYTSLFEGVSICLAPIDHEKDPEVEAKWTNDPEYLRGLATDPARPLAPAQVKKKYEALEKEIEEGKNSFYFTIRARSDDRLIGFGQLYWIEWSHGSGWVRLGIGDRNDRGKGYGKEALGLLLRYAFSELSLFRLSAVLSADNPIALNLFQGAGFVEEVRRRQAVNRDGKRWDLVHLGMLREEWERGRVEGRG